MGVALAAVADDGDLLAGDERQVRVIVVLDLSSHRFPFKIAGCRVSTYRIPTGQIRVRPRVCPQGQAFCPSNHCGQRPVSSGRHDMPDIARITEQIRERVPRQGFSEVRWDQGTRTRYARAAVEASARRQQRHAHRHVAQSGSIDPATQLLRLGSCRSRLVEAHQSPVIGPRRPSPGARSSAIVAATLSMSPSAASSS